MKTEKDCGFCYPREQGTHGEIKREWSPEWLMFIPVCRKHAIADGMLAYQDKYEENTPYSAADGISNLE